MSRTSELLIEYGKEKVSASSQKLEMLIYEFNFGKNWWQWSMKRRTAQ